MNGILDITLLILAYLVGSLLNVIIYRLPIQLELKAQTQPSFKYFNLWLPRSHCPSCGEILRWWQNIPIFSYLFLKGRCYFCKNHLSSRYLIIEVVYPLLVFIALKHFDSPVLTLAASLLIALLLIQTAIDFELMLLPDPLNYSLIWSGLSINSFGLFCRLDEAVWGAIVAYLSLWGFYHLIKWSTKKEGFGYGDFKLFAGIGAWLGIGQLCSVMFLASFLGIILALGLYCIRRDKLLQQPIPFGPSLAMAAYCVLLNPRGFNLWALH